MKTSWKTLKRCIALVLAMAILLSTSNFGFVGHVHAVEDEPGTKLSALIAANYDLPEALEKIIQSGMLKAEKEITYEQPEEDVIEVDSDTKTITAHSTNGWDPVTAKIKVGDEVVETVTLNEGVGTYGYAGNAFSVVVTYELYEEVTADEQLALINAAYYLAQDIETVGCLRDGAVELVLSTLTSEMEQLKDVEGITLNGTTPVDLINQLATVGIELPALTLGGATTVLKFDDIADSIDDAAALLADKNDGDNMLVLYSLLKKHSALSSLELLDKYSVELMDALKSNYDNIEALANDEYGLAYVLRKLQKYNEDAIAAIEQAKEDLEAAGAELAAAEALVAQLREAEAFLAEAKSLLEQYHTAKGQIAAAREALAEYNAAIAKINEGIALINTYYDAKEALDDKADEVAQVEQLIDAYEAAAMVIDTLGGIDRAKSILALNPANTNLKNAIDLYERFTPAEIAEMQAGVDDYYAGVAELEAKKNEADAQLKANGITLSFTDRAADIQILTNAKNELTAEANKQLEPYGATVDTAAAKLDEAEAKLDAEVQKVIDDNNLGEQGVAVDNIDDYLAQQEAKLNAAKAEADAELKKIDPTASIDKAEEFIAAAKKELADAEAYLTNAETVLLPQLAEVADAMDLLIDTLQKFCSKAKPAYECDSWNVVDMDILRDDLSTASYTKLGGMVEALDETKLYTAQDVKTSLLVDTKEIQYNMSMFDVSIEVTVYKLDGTVGSNNLIEAEKLTGKVTLEEGATHAAIKEAIEAANVVPTVDLTYYQTPVVTDLPETLTEDITYTVKYYPNTYTYKIMDGANELTTDTVYYGYQLRLPAYTGTEEQVYEYHANGKTYSQNEIVKITDDVVFARAQGKPRTGISIKDIIANNMAGGMTSNALVYGLSSEATAILKNAAVRSDKINLRVPAAADVTIEFVGDKITATGYASDFGGLYWKPVAVNFVADSGVVVDTAAMVNGEATITDKNYARANIKYELVIDSISDDALEMLNLPDVLVQEYIAQESAIAILDAKYSALAQLDSSKVGMMIAATKDMDPEIYNAALSIQQNCMDGENLALYNLLTGYHTDGMAYYYRNYEAFVRQANLLTAALETLWGDADNQAALLAVMYEYADILNMTKEEIDKYIEPLGQLLEALRGMNLIAPNAAIDLESDDLSALVDAILAAQGKTQKYTSVSEDPALYISNIGKDAPDYISWNIELYVDGKLMIPATAPTSITFRLDKSTNSYTLTADDMTAIDNMVEAAFDEINASLGNILNLNYYTVAPIGELPKEGTVLTETTTFGMSYNAKEFTVSVEGTADQIISMATTLKVNLPAGNSAVRYDYIIDGKTVPAGSYTFTKLELTKLFDENGNYTIERVETKLNPVGDKLQGVVDNMNGGDVKVELDTTENEDGTYTYEMDMVIPTTVMSNPAGMTQMGMALFSGYTYIEMNGKVLLDGTKMYAQALLDAVMNSGLNGKTIQNIANNNGGKLFTCELTMGASAEDANKVTTTLNIYLEGDNAELDMVAHYLAMFENYVSITCTDGGLVMDLTLPEKAYQAYLAAMLMLDQRDLKNINDVDGKVALGYILDVMDPVLKDETLTLDTFVNTLNMLGYGVDVAMFEPFFDQMVDIFNALVWNYDEDGIATTLTGRESVINLLKEKLGAMGGMVSDENIQVNITLNVTNLTTDYEAAFVDISAEGILNKVGMTTDLAGKSFAGKGAIVLLSDIGSEQAPVSLSFNDFTVIDLNGYTIYGDVTAKTGTVYICDSTLAVENEGSVTGKLTGEVRITAGKYEQDVTANLMDGYIKDANGNVKNDYYTITEDADGNYTITLNAAAVRRNNLPDFKTIGLDMILDLALNAYDKGAMKIAGYKIYDIALENIVDSYVTADKVDKLLDDIINGTAAQGSWFDVEELAELYDVVVADLTNFDNIANGEYLAKYEIETAPWELSVFVDGDHLSGGVGALSGKFEKRTVTIVLSEDNVSEAVKDLAAELDNILNVESDLDMSQNKDGNNIQIDVNYKTSNVVIDLTGDNNYIVAIGTLLADVVKNNNALLAGLESYEKYGATNQLKVAIDNCTVSDLLTALANVDGGYDFSKLGALGETYKDVLRLAGAVIRKLDIQDRGSMKLGGAESDEYAVYVLDKQNFSRSKTKDNLFRDYDVTVNVNVPLASVTVKLCNACGHGNAQKVGAQDATCTEDGNIEHWFCADCRTYFLDAECTRRTTADEVIIPATGHAYDVAWNWAADYSWAIATFTCTNDGCTAAAGYAKDEAIDTAITENASCEKEGTKTHTASVVFDGKTYEDVKTESIDKLAHTYTTAPNSWEWTKTATGYDVVAIFVCSECNGFVRVAADVTSVSTGASCTEPGKITYTATAADSEANEYTNEKVDPISASGHDAVYVPYKAATCTEPGNVEYWYCGDCGKYFKDAECTGEILDIVIPATGHAYSVEWSWATDYSSATAIFTCGNDGCTASSSYVKDEQIDSAETEKASCNKEGTMTYTASVEFGGETYTTTATQPIEKLAHTYTGAPSVWNWTKTATGYDVEVIYYCDVCSEEIKLTATVTSETIGATCTQDGKIVYTAAVKDSTGANFTDTKEEPIIADGHSYVVTWAWEADFSGAKATFTCADCDEVNDVVTADVTANGNGIYVATATYEGVLYMDIATEEHDLVLDGWTWDADYSKATAHLRCETCDEKHDVGVISTSVTTDATCTSTGETVYTVELTVSGIKYTDTKTVLIPEKDHDLDYTAQNKPGCLEDGNVEYWFCANCNKYFADEDCTEELTDVTLPATGHSYGAPVWVWAADNSSAVAKFTCGNCSDAAFAEAKSTSTTDAADCTEAGKITYKVTVTFAGEQYTTTKEVAIEATGHAYTLVGWTWSADLSSATAKFSCANCGDEPTQTVATTSKTYDATCTENGKTVYTAELTFEGETYTDTKIVPIAAAHKPVYVAAGTASCTENGNVEHWYCSECGKYFADEECKNELNDVVIPATGHNYGAPEWAWAGDNSSAVAKFTCSKCSNVEFVEAKSESVTNAAGCESSGSILYTVKVTFGGEEYTTSKTVVLAATGHAYKLEGWTWAADYSSATVKLVCENKGCIKTVDAQFINKVTTAPTCTETGKNVYTAVVTVDGVTYTDTKEQTIDATGHDYELEGWTWAADLKTADAKFVCETCGDVHTANVTVQTKTDAASCTADGKITYTASVTLDGDTYTDVKEQRIPATGHTYAQTGWNWSADHSSATVTVKCSCGDTQTVTAIVSTKTTEPTFNADGSIVYTATAIYNGQTFTDTYTQVLKYKLSIDSVKINTNDKVVGVKFAENDLIYLDIQPDGITAEQLLELLKVEYQADVLTYNVVNSDKDAGLLCNGSQLVITAANKDGKSITRTYAIIIIGDVNSNGMIEVADNYLILSTLVGVSNAELNQYELLAADVNMNGGLDVADSSRNMNKLVFWDSYITSL